MGHLRDEALSRRFGIGHKIPFTSCNELDLGVAAGRISMHACRSSVLMMTTCVCALLMQHVYGKEAVKRGPNEWDARACVEGDYSWAEQQPDNDLGKSITPGFRNAIVEGRAFGVPSIRSDIEPYAQRSVADTQNYGDDSSARQVWCLNLFVRESYVHTAAHKYAFCCSLPSLVPLLEYKTMI